MAKDKILYHYTSLEGLLRRKQRRHLPQLLKAILGVMRMMGKKLCSVCLLVLLSAWLPEAVCRSQEEDDTEKQAAVTIAPPDEAATEFVISGAIAYEVEPNQCFIIPPSSRLHSVLLPMATADIHTYQGLPLKTAGQGLAFASCEVTTSIPARAAVLPDASASATIFTTSVSSVPTTTLYADGTLETVPMAASVFLMLETGQLLRLTRAETGEQVVPTKAEKEAQPMRPDVVDFAGTDTPCIVRFQRTTCSQSALLLRAQFGSDTIAAKAREAGWKLTLGFRESAEANVICATPPDAFEGKDAGGSVTGAFFFVPGLGEGRRRFEAVLMDSGSGKVIATKAMQTEVSSPGTVPLLLDERCEAAWLELMSAPGGRLGDKDAETVQNRAKRLADIAVRIRKIPAETVFVSLGGTEALLCETLRQLVANLDSRVANMTAFVQEPTAQSGLPASDCWLGASRFFLSLVPAAFVSLDGNSRLESDDIICHGLGVGYQLSNDSELVLTGLFGEIETEGEPTLDPFIKGLVIEGEDKEHTLSIVELLFRYSPVGGSNLRLLLCAGPSWWSAHGDSAVGVTAGVGVQWRLGDSVSVQCFVRRTSIDLKIDEAEIDGGTSVMVALEIYH